MGKVVDPKLKRYLDAAKYETLVVGAVDRYIQRRTSDRDQTVIHPSEMVQWDWCPRATWLRLKTSIHTPEALTLRPALIFAEGDTIHEKWQRWLREMGVLWGRWECPACETVALSWSSDLDALFKCYQTASGKHLWKYKEVPFDDPAYRIKGHADGVVRTTGGEVVLIEIKSIGPGTLRMLELLPEGSSDDEGSDKFSKITRPLRSHFIQTQVYLRLLEQYEELIGEISRAVIIYEYKADQQYKEFAISRLDKWTDELFETAKDIVWALDNDREIKCPHGGCKQCRAYEEQ